ncbi:MFS transporter [Leptolyngbya sp. FACHB-17]|uniref:MFS transporter n=1 Tax=unclassified Leptolyngbya TaxID=2650499 RepID=UPI001680ECC8|nr:MFS transporter [Leptolyngbya sp. FACHB-17]MBD2080429.1 MFS transporter [Leptolyngbya sp. FACHB-17]
MPPTLTFRQTLLYSCTSISINLINTAVSTWLLYYYAPPPTTGAVQYLSVTVVGLLLAIGRVWNAIIDPFIGHWSDTTCSPWGRRTPFLVIGSLMTLGSLLLLWTPLTAYPSWLNAFYFLTMAIVLYTGISLVGVPYDGSLPEMAATAAERVRLSMWKNIFGIVGVLGGAIIGSAVYNQWGAIAMGGVIGILGVVTVGLTLPVLPKRSLPTLDATDKTEVIAALSFWQSLRSTLRNRPFLILCSSTILVQTAYAMLLSNLPYFVALILQEPEAAVGRYQSLVVIVMLAAAPVWNRMSRYGSDRQLLKVSLLGLALATSFLTVVGWTSALPNGIQAAICFGFLGPFLGGYFILVYAMMGTVVEQDAIVTGQRREAFHYSIFSFSAGMGLSFSTLIIPPIFSYYGYTLEHPAGVRVVFLVAAALVVLGVIVFQGYRLEDAPIQG